MLRQILAVTLLNLRTIGERRGSSAVAIIGIAGVVAVFVAVLSMGEGFRKTMASTGSVDTAIALRAGVDSEMTSIMGFNEVQVVLRAPGVRSGPDGPIASAELFVIVDLPKRSTGTIANVGFRGVQPAAFAIRDRLRIVEGRSFRTGQTEVIAGRGAAAQFSELNVGSTVRWGQHEWAVVGVFDTGGTVADSEVWCDVAVLAPLYHRFASRQSVYVKLESADAFERFSSALAADPRVNLKAVRETEYYAGQSRQLSSVITGLGTLIAGLMGIGAIFGALNTMYAAVSARTREIATLRALGFGGAPVVISVLAESMLLALIGGALGGGLAYVAFNGYRTSTLNWQSFSQIAFAFAITPSLLWRGLAYGLLMGLVGGIFPAVRAARMPVASALREL